MATLNAQYPSLLDVAKRSDPNGAPAAVAELLSQTNPILEDAYWVEGNLPTGHRTTVRTGLPTAYWRLLNQGVQPSKSTTAQIDENAGMLEAWSVVDKDLAMLNGNTNAFRLSEASAFIEAMGQEMAQTMFYGNSSVNPEEFNGLSVRYGAISGAANSDNVIDGGGSGSDNTSIWLVVWGPNTVNCIYPKGSVAGLQHKNLGESVVDNAGGVTGAKMLAFQDQFQWKCGVSVRDWRFAARACNIDVSSLVAGSGADVPDLMIKLLHRIHSLKAGRPVFYMNRTVAQYLDLQRRNDVISGGGLTYMDVDGKLVPSFRGVPIKVTDALLETEARVV
jgi:hypothetical protein